MQVSVETTSALERQMTITVPAERIDNDVDKRVQQTARTVRIDGFRPGKVPLKVVKQRYGAGIRQDVVGEVVQKSFFEAVQQEKVMPAGSPKIEFKNDEDGKDFQFVATFEVYPEITLADFSSAEIEKQTSEVTDADVDTMIDTLRKQQATWTEVERAAEDGDRVKVDFEGFIDGEAFEGGKAEGTDIVLGSNSMIPGFESGIVGKKAGEEFELNVTFPEDYQAENLKGKDAVFKTKVISVSAPELPELNDEFFSKFGLDVSDLEGFKTEVGANMGRELKNALKAKLKDQVFTQLVDINGIEVPTSLVDSEIDNLRKQAVQQFGGGAEIDPNMLPKEMFEEQAKRRVTVGLLVQEIIKANDIKADDARVAEAIQEMASTYQEPQQVIDWYNSNEEMLNQVKSLVLEDQVVDHLLESAKVTEVAVAYEEAIKPAANAAA
ncbi:trigger factor [Neptunomonas phycophila]|jgi:trigger factor|uniref:Trigger factor n=1 Tax=Neptunomonas phycophila TaxID=1572645 RepID=A0AAW7XIB5_9GAMM|nr:trigger factor [Neptunomonas phycophila]MDO6454048.1 trigger factor [Neptunomonas phycophila]QLE97540.1 trigger factor [Neptunomonas phycophila]